MNIRCCLCGDLHKEEAFFVTTSAGEQLISFCADCRRAPADYKKRVEKITGYCPHGEPIRSRRKDSIHTYNCERCVAEWYIPEAAKRQQKYHEETGLWRQGRKKHGGLNS